MDEENNLPLEPEVEEIILPTDETPIPVPTPPVEDKVDEDEEETPPAEDDQEEDKLLALIERKGLKGELSDDRSSVRHKAVATFTNTGKKSREDYRPSDEELARINNGYSNVDLARDEVYVFGVHSADDQIDRQMDKFQDPALSKMATLSLDKAFLLDHDWSTRSQIGKIFDATASGGKLLQKVYVLDIAENQYVLKNMFGGVFNKVSVGFSTALRDMECSACKKSIYDEECPHMPGHMDENGNIVHVNIKDVSDFYEVSIVPIPAQREAGIRRNPMPNEEMSLSLGSKGMNDEDQSITESAFECQQGKNLLEISAEIKKVDTINSGNTQLGEISVEESTTQDSTTQAPEASPAEATELTATADDTTVTAVAPEAPAAEAVEDTATVTEEKTSAPAEDVSSVLSEIVKALQEVTAALKTTVDEQKALITAQKEAAEAVSKSVDDKVKALETAQAEQETKIKLLAQIVEAATVTTLESLERDAATRKQTASTQSAPEGNEWALDFAKSILGGR